MKLETGVIARHILSQRLVVIVGRYHDIYTVRTIDNQKIKFDTTSINLSSISPLEALAVVELDVITHE